MGIAVLDKFQRPNGSVGKADSGQAWSADAGTWAISSNALACTVNGAGPLGCSLSADAGHAVQDVQSTYLSGSWTAGTGMGVIARCTDLNNFWFAFIYVGSVNNNTYVYSGKCVAGSVSYAIANAVFQYNGHPVTGSALRLTVDSGNNWKCFLNGVQVGSTTTDSALSTATRCGFVSDDVTGGLWTPVQVRHTDW